MYNKVILVGNLTRDIELRYTPGGLAIAKTGLATNRRYKSQNGEQKEETCFIDITIFGRAAEIANQYLSKGRRVLVEGRLVYEQWADKDGQKRSKHSVAVDELKMLDSAERSGNEPFAPSDVARHQEAKQNFAAERSVASERSHDRAEPKSSGYNLPEINIEDDEIPF